MSASNKNYKKKTNKKFIVWENGEQLYLIDFESFKKKPKKKKKVQKEILEYKLNELNVITEDFKY